MKLVHWPLTGGAVTFGTARRGLGGLLSVPNVTAHSSTASVPITVWLYNGPLLSGFNVPQILRKRLLTVHSLRVV